MAHVLVLYNQPMLPSEHPESESEAEILDTVEHVSTALNATGHRVTPLGIGPDPADIVPRLRQVETDVVFNLFEGVPNEGESESCVAGLLEWLHMPFTGSPARALTLARDKPSAKLTLSGGGVPTAEFCIVAERDDPCLLQGPNELRSPFSGRVLRWPLIVKPADQDASVGIDQESVVTSAVQLRRRVQMMLDRFAGTVLVEEYIAGRELTVGVIETPMPGQPKGTRRALPASEYEFRPEGNPWPIVTYSAKWKASPNDEVETPYHELASLTPRLEEELSELALRTFGLLGLRDYGRIDYRITAEGQPIVLEANPNPDLGPNAGLNGALGAVGLTYTDLIAGLVDRALSRRPQR